MIFTLNDIKEILPNSEFYNFPDEWAADGFRIWHEDFKKGSIALVRGENDKKGILSSHLKEIIDFASAIVTTQNPEKYKKYNKPIVKINDVADTIVKFGKYARSKFKGTVIAVTGSCGKTTCTSIIQEILAKYGAEKNTDGNTLYGISWNLTTFNPDDKYWVVETSLGGRMRKNTEVVIPHYAIVTNIAPVHLEGDLDTSFIATRKAEIFESMQEGQYAILYKEMDKFEILEKKAKEKKLKIITFGENNADVIINQDENNNWIQIENQKINLKQSYLPKHILLDMAAALIVAKLENIDINEILQCLNNFKYIEGRGQTNEGNISPNKKITFVDEAYNANPVSMKFALDGFSRQFAGDNQKVLILGDMSEGGKDSLLYHLQLAEIIRQINPSRVLLCGELMKNLWDVIKFEFKGAYYKNYSDLNQELLSWLKDGDKIFIKSSNSIKLYETVNFLKKATEQQNCEPKPKEILIKNELTETKEKVLSLFSSEKDYIPSIFLYEYKKQFGIRINENEIYPAASVIKLPILFELIKQISESGNIKFSDTLEYTENYKARGSGILKDKQPGEKYTVEYLANIMISESDNIASNMLLDKIGGIDYLNEICKKWGFKNIIFKNKFPDLGGTNKITAFEISKLLYNLENEDFIKKDYAKIIKNYLIQTKNVHHLKAKLPKTAKFYHKTGSLDLMLGDSGIVVDDDNNCKYLITAMVKIPYKKNDAEFNKNARTKGKELLQQLSLIIYNDIVKLN